MSSEEDSLPELLPLSKAADLVYQAAKGEVLSDPQTRHNIARAIATRTRLFARMPGHDEYTLIMPDEISDGIFSPSTATLLFADGRPVLEDVRILSRVLPSLIAEFRTLLARDG